MTTKKTTLAARWASETDVSERLRQARDNRAAHKALVASLESQTQRKRAELEQSLAALSPPAKTAAISRAVASYRADLRRNSADLRKSNVRAAEDHRASVAPARTHYGSAVQMLMRQSLGSERRSRLLQQISTSGPAELASYAQLAAATADFELAAALCSRNATLKPAERSFSSRELAEALVGERHKQVAADLLEIERLSTETAVEDTAFETGKRDAIATLKIALMKQSEAAAREGLPPPQPQAEVE